SRPKPMSCWRRSMAGLQRALIRPTCRRPKRCWRRWCNTTLGDMFFPPTLDAYIPHLLSVKRLHGVRAGNTVEEALQIGSEIFRAIADVLQTLVPSIEEITVE